MDNSEETMCLLADKIKLGEEFMEQLQPIENIDGVMKLNRKIRQEIEFLKRLQRSKKVKVEQLACSNLRHLGAMVECSKRPGVLAVCKIFHINDTNKLLIDIVSDHGKTWTKVIARNPKSLSALSAGKASYGARSILDQAEDYLECAKLYPCMYQPPKGRRGPYPAVERMWANNDDYDDYFIFLRTYCWAWKSSTVERSKPLIHHASLVEVGGHSETNKCPFGEYLVFEFMSGIEENLANKLKAVGIIVKGEILPSSIFMEDCDDTWDSESSDDEALTNTQCQDQVSQCVEEHPQLNTLNLDVTAMMAFISNMTNGYCNYIFKQEVLTQQCAWEAERPVKPVLERLFQGKSLVCCRTAWDDFEKIVNTLGGPMEKSRAEELKKMVTVFPDDYGGEDDYPRKNLKVRGHVRLRSKVIFNFGHRIKAVTVSANEGFIRSSHQQGVTYAAFIHESRALTEGKENTAQKIKL